jgi:Arc/MetJ family transcription regulator
MRVTIDIDDALLEQAAKLTGIRRKSDLVCMGLIALVARESARRLADLGGSEKHFRPGRRRRSRRV